MILTLPSNYFIYLMWPGTICDLSHNDFFFFIFNLVYFREYFEDVDRTWETFEKTLWCHISNFYNLSKERYCLYNLDNSLLRGYSFRLFSLYITSLNTFFATTWLEYALGNESHLKRCLRFRFLISSWRVISKILMTFRDGENWIYVGARNSSLFHFLMPQSSFSLSFCIYPPPCANKL